jgi:hypothetical protein
MRPRENQNANQVREKDLLQMTFFSLSANLRVTNMCALENSLMSSKGIGLKSYVQLLEASVKALSHVVIQFLSALSAGLRPVEGLLGPRRFHYCRLGGIAFTPGTVRHHLWESHRALAGQRWRARRHPESHHDLRKHRD